MGDQIPGLPGSKKLVRFQHASMRRWLLLFMAAAAIAATGAGFFSFEERESAERACRGGHGERYASFEECMESSVAGSDFLYLAAGFGAAFVLLGGLWVMLRERTPAFVATLANEPSRIETVYVEEWRLRGAPAHEEGDCFVVITLEGGGERRLATPTRASASEVLSAVTRVASQVRVETPRERTQ